MGFFPRQVINSPARRRVTEGHPGRARGEAAAAAQPSPTCCLPAGPAASPGPGPLAGRTENNRPW